MPILAFLTPIFGILNALFLAFKMPILVINTSHFGILNAKSVLRNLRKVKRHFWHLNAIFWHLKRRRLVFMKWTPVDVVVRST